MIARMFGFLVLLQIILLAWLANDWITGQGTPLHIVALSVIGIFLAISAVVPVTTCALSRILAYRGPNGQRLGPFGILMWLGAEFLAYIALFIVIQPLERLFLGSDAIGRLPPGQRPVLMIHGYMCNRGFWWWLRRKLRANGFAVATINLEPPFGDMEQFSNQLHERIDALRAETGAEQVYLICHSMGGLVARGRFRRFGTEDIAGLITLGTPHRGTKLAHLGLGLNARGMRPNSHWFSGTLPKAPPVPTLSVWSPWDNFIMPQDSSRLDGAEECIIPALGHLTMAFSPAILAAITERLAQIERR